ncbi:DUF2207 domain-containing protein, partial [Balneolaceae bacterium ANBcel3]|nr:DUF2207 domain-containing protein [Balneolaceae bacterium ANBcel3]
MKRKILFIFILFSPLCGFSRDYQIQNISIDAQIRSDGSVHYAETRHFDFDGAYSEAFFTVSLDGFDYIEDIRVYKNGTPLINERSEETGTFRVDRFEDYLEIAWPIETEEEPIQTYTVTYDLLGALLIGADHAEWFWTFISDNLDRVPGDVDISITFPEPIAEEQMHLWLRDTPASIGKEIKSDQIRLFLKEGETLKRREEVEARIIFPTSGLTRAAVSHPFFTLERALAEEQEWKDQQKKKAQRYILGLALMFTLIPGSLFLFFWFYKNYGKRYKPDTSSLEEYLYTPPGWIHPSQMRLVYYNSNYVPDAKVLSIALFELCRKGYFRIAEKKGEKEFLGSESPVYELELTGKKGSDDLLSWEVLLYEHVHQRITSGNTRMDKLFEWDTSEKIEWWKSWQKDFHKDFNQHHWFDEASYKAMKLHA